jgi:hypothetical protein
MAIWYVAHGNTTDGDGTSPADGAVGAWNNLVDVVTPTGAHYAEITAGDVVYVRSCDATDADINISNDLFNLIYDVQYIIDDGTIWPSSGNITWTINSYVSSAQVSFPGMDSSTPVRHFDAPASNFYLIADDGYTPGTYSDFGIVFGTYTTKQVVVRGLNFTLTDNGSSVTDRAFALNLYAAPYILFESGSLSFLRKVSGSFPIINSFIKADGTYSSTVVFKDLTLTTPSQSDDLHPLIGSYSGGPLFGIHMTGVTWLGSSPHYRICKYSTSAVYYRMPVLFEYGSVSIDKLTPIGVAPIANNQDTAVRVIGRKFVSGLSTFFHSDGFCTRMYEPGSAYPTLSAVDGTGASWSIRAIPLKLTSSGSVCVADTSLFVTDVSGVTDFIIEFLLSPSHANQDTYNWWVELHYKTTSGDLITVSTRAVAAGTPLATSTAEWSSVLFASEAHTKRKIAITIPGDIEIQNIVELRLYTADSSIGESANVFIDPMIAMG